jgi:hypothetical protein
MLVYVNVFLLSAVAEQLDFVVDIVLDVGVGLGLG